VKREAVRSRRDSDGLASARVRRGEQENGKFTIDTLVEMLSRAGKPVKLTIG
jgi:predicted XRE-type DNA-binding protein